MVHLVRKVVNQRIQCTAMLARAKVFEAVREFDGMFEVSSCILAVAAIFSITSNSLAQLVDEVCKTLRAINCGHTSVVSWPPRH